MAKARAKAKAAIDEAQDALDEAEAALDAADSPIGEVETKPKAKPGKTVTFTVADALIQLGRDSQFASSHAIHRTVIAVRYHDDGTIAVGSYVGEVDGFDREEAGRVAMSRIGDPA